MKKTIAKIMAAAMVVSTISAPNVLAANVPAVTELYIGSSKVITEGRLADDYPGKTESSAVEIDGTALLNAMNSSTNKTVSWTVTDENGYDVTLSGEALDNRKQDALKLIDSHIDPYAAIQKH